jgi:hypothetical protein
VNCLNSNAGGIMRADYLVYYYNVVQRKLQWLEQWRYFDRHYLPEYRVNLHGLDYVLIYRNPIQNHIDRTANSLPGVFTAFGYNLATDGQLTLFWQNLRLLDRRKLTVGLAPSNGRYLVNAPAVNSAGERYWVACMPAPAFVDEMYTPKAIIESLCPLATANLPPGLYDLQIGLSNGLATSPVASSFLAVLSIDSKGRFTPVKLAPAPAPSP